MLTPLSFGDLVDEAKNTVTCRGVKLHLSTHNKECPGYNTKSSDGEASVLVI